jgi:hypothetical protein
MDIKKTLLAQAMKLAQNPKVMEIAMNPKVMEVAMKAMSARAQVSTAATAPRTPSRGLNLATRDEVKELRRTIRKLEDQLAPPAPDRVSSPSP